jgi:ParB family chromosome partitioning protein
MGGAAATSELVHVPVGSIRANSRQPRKRLDAEGIDELAESIRAQGLVQPVVVRPAKAGGYELIAGERRWRAARVAGLATVPAVVREDLSPVDEARAYAALMDEFGLGLGDVAERVGRSKPTVSNRVRLLELPDDVLGLVERGQLSEGHARAVLAVPDHEERRRLARRIVRGGMSVRAAERAARWAGARTKPRRRQPVDPALAGRVREALHRLTGADAKVTAGRVELYFADEVELEELAEALERASLQSPGAGD